MGGEYVVPIYMTSFVGLYKRRSDKSDRERLGASTHHCLRPLAICPIRFLICVEDGYRNNPYHNR